MEREREREREREGEGEGERERERERGEDRVWREGGELWHERGEHRCVCFELEMPIVRRQVGIAN